MKSLLVLIAVTAVWGVTFVQVKDAVALACAVIMAGIVIAEPAAAGAAARLVRRT